MQEGILFHSVLRLDNGAYYQQWCCVLNGALDIPAFKQAWRRVIERHAVLRTAFNWQQRYAPFQVVYRQVEAVWQQDDWRWVTVDDQKRQLDALLTADRDRGFDFARAPLMRFFLIRHAEKRYQFVWSYHHLLFDGWSLPILLKEVFQFYDALCQHQDFHPPLPRPYHAYIAWLRRQDLSAAEAFWRAALQGFLGPIHLNLASQQKKASCIENAYDERQLQLSVPATAALQDFVHRHGLSLNTLILGAWGILLSRYSGQEDVLFGSTVAGRPAKLEGIESMVGLFINTLPVRVQVSSDALLLPWLQTLQACQVEARQYEFSPLVQVQGWAGATSGQPLFESLLVFENYPDRATWQAWSKSLKIDNIRLVSRTNYPLTVVVAPGSALRLRISYQRQYIDAPMVMRMLEHLRILLEGMVLDPYRKLAHLALLSQTEREQLLVKWNETQVFYPDACIHHLIEAQALRTPEAVAVVFEDDDLTYSQLNRRANHLAYMLQTIGVGPEVLVGICVEPSFNMVVGLLGILKAGGAYVPLDPEYPAERLAFMLSDTQAPVLVTQQKFATMFQDHGLHMICVDTVELERGDGEHDSNPVSGVAPRNLAYVMYTSGSTGTPKGVMIPHRALRNHMAWMQDTFPLTAVDRVLHQTSMSFDAAVWELFAPLSTGGRLILVRAGGHRDSEHLIRLITQHRVTILKLVPALLQMLIADDAFASCHSLRHVFCGGETLPASLQRQFFSRLNASLHNLYGPTETTIDVTAWTCLRESQSHLVPIGRPIANTRIYLLDAHLRPVPIGVPGELYIGGASLARGYLNRPALNLQNFIQDPFINRPGERLYKTGDLARYLPDGHIELIGRLDDQVKIRGYRIELGEVRTALEQYPALRQAIVLAQRDTTGNRVLVAYVVVDEQTVPDHHALRAFLQTKLPEYMIPSAFMKLETMPLTSNGKIDQQALPVPWRDQRELDKAAVEPRTPIEELLTGIWATILGIKSLETSDNFFALGGHSLLAMQVIARIRDVWQMAIPLRAIFDRPTVASLAHYLETLSRPGRNVPSLREAARPRQREVPTTVSQAHFWKLDRLLPGAPFSNMTYAMRLKGVLNVSALEQGCCELVARHDILRTTFTRHAERITQVTAPARKVPLIVEKLSTLPQTTGRDVATKRLIRQATLFPFDLTQGPLIRFYLLQIDAHEHVFLITIHHIISDGWSLRRLVHELSTLYRAFLHGERSPLPPLQTQYADFACWQERWLHSEAGELQLAYWRKQLRGPLPTLMLPTDYPRSSALNLHTVHRSFRLPRVLSEAIKRFGYQESATLFMTLVAALNMLLYCYTKQTDIRIGTLVANRHLQETETLIGLFVNLVVLRTKIDEHLTLRDVLKHTRTTTLDAYTHQALPFEYLAQTLEREQTLDRLSLFQVMFAMEYDRQPPNFFGLDVQTIRTFPLTASACDLAIAVREIPAGLDFLCTYKPTLFHVATIDHLFQHLQHVVECLISTPLTRLATLRDLIQKRSN